MKKDNSILSKLLDHLIGEAEGGECDEIDKWTSEKDSDDKGEADVVNEESNDDDDHAKKLKKFMSSIKD